MVVELRRSGVGVSDQNQKRALIDLPCNCGEYPTGANLDLDMEVPHCCWEGKDYRIGEFILLYFFTYYHWSRSAPDLFGCSMAIVSALLTVCSMSFWASYKRSGGVQHVGECHLSCAWYSDRTWGGNWMGRQMSIQYCRLELRLFTLLGVSQRRDWCTDWLTVKKRDVVVVRVRTSKKGVRLKWEKFSLVVGKIAARGCQLLFLEALIVATRRRKRSQWGFEVEFDMGFY